jgi:prepilin-type N-terminal cleavage/methylation domain-containing protein
MEWGARHSRSHSRRPRAFTILEVLLALALLGLLATLLVGGAGRLLEGRGRSAEEVFWKAATEARRYALLRGEDVRLVYDSETKVFSASTREGTQRFPVPVAGELLIEFLAAGTSGGPTVLIGGSLVETQPLPFVTFYADGTCSSFRVQLRNRRAAEPRYLQIDPWTCAPVLNRATSGGGRGGS